MIKKVLVYTYGKQSHAAAIKAAAVFADQNRAEITGLFVTPDIMNYSAVYGEYPLALASEIHDIQADYAKEARAQFEDIVSAYDIKSQWHEVDQYEKKPRPSFYTDFTFVGQPTTEGDVIFNDTDFIDNLIVGTGIPTIIVPNDWSADKFAQYPLLGWKETKEAIGAVHHSLPLMREANKVDILSVTKRTNLDQELVEGIEISEFLTEHDVTCKFYAEQQTEDDRHESDALLRHVNTYGCDLIIVGGYGHSRFRQIILGGMTRKLMKNSPVPVLLSH